MRYFNSHEVQEILPPAWAGTAIGQASLHCIEDMVFENVETSLSGMLGVGVA